MTSTAPHPQPPTLEKHEPPSTLLGGRRNPPGKRNGGARGKRGVAEGRWLRARSRQRTYPARARRAVQPRGPSYGRRAAGAPASCPTCGARVAKRRRAAGEKGAGEARPAPGAGGRRQDRTLSAALTLTRGRPGGNGKAVTVTSPPLGDRATADHPPSPMGVPPYGHSGWGFGAGGGDAARTVQGAGGGRGGASGESRNPAALAGHPGGGKGRKRPTSDTTLRLAAQCGRGGARASGRGGRFQALRGGAEPPGRPAPARTAAAGGSPRWDCRRAPERDLRASPAGCQRLGRRKGLPSIQQRIC